ncbi:hypothetical protein P692DRAFT_201854611 [Suillus brevipes Sb2]|nr:hypothetical protein P692DRAFT_201854611 [Suillus brevipes Sb2]
MPASKNANSTLKPGKKSAEPNYVLVIHGGAGTMIREGSRSEVACATSSSKVHRESETNPTEMWHNVAVPQLLIADLQLGYLAVGHSVRE